METTKGSRTIRAFCAIPLDAPLRKQIAQLQQHLAEKLPGVRWSRLENLHLTLRFFGDIEAESLEKAAKLMLSVNALGGPFKLPLQRLGAFPSTTRPRVLWLGFAGCDAMQQLYARCSDLLHQAGIPKEARPFTPHLTLGRAKGRLPDVTELLRHEECDIQGVLPIERLVFYRSRLLPAGAEHTPLYTVELDRSTTN